MIKDRFLVLQASAGSGKTFSLVSRYLTLLLKGASPNKILAITFTRKATKEMYERVVTALKDPNSGELKAVKDELKLSEEKFKERVDEVLRDFLSSESKIKTIDSFQKSILKKFSNYIDLIPNFVVGSSIDSDGFNRDFLIRSEEYYKKFILNIQRVDPSISSETIIETLESIYKHETEFQDYLKNRGTINIEFQNIIELENMVMTLAFIISNELISSGKLSKTAVKALTFSNFEELLNAGKSWLQKETLEEYKVFKKGEPTQELNMVFDRLKTAIDSLFKAKNSYILDNFFQLFRFYVEVREGFLKRTGKLSYEDIDHFLLKLLLNREVDSQFIYFRLDSQIDHFLIDEFQDTSLTQYRILEPLFEDILSGGSNIDKSFFYVGDIKQAIYRFRGGFSDLFNYLKDNYSIPEKSLIHNYRSRIKIVNFVNMIFRDYYDNYTPQEIGKEIQVEGFVSISTTSSDDIFSDALSEVQRLLELGVKQSEIAILTNSNSDSAFIDRILQEAELKTELDTSLSILTHGVVKAVVEYMKYLYFGDEFYLKTFLAFIGKSPFERPDKRVKYRENIDKPFDIALKIVDMFDLYRGDPNIPHTLQIFNKFSDMSEFIFNYADIEDSRVKSSTGGINITTIHKSKGLQFPYVILLDSRKPNVKSPQLLYKYENIGLIDMVWKFNKDLQSDYVEAMEFESSAVNIDNINRYYVAFTRAISGLKILRLDKRSSISDAIPNLQDVTYGDIEKTVLDSSCDIEPKVDRGFSFNRDITIQSLGREADEVEEEGESIETYSDHFERIKFQTIGTAVHSAIEMMSKFKQSEIKPVLMNVKNRFSDILSEQDFKDIEGRLNRLLANREFQELISRAETIKRENPYQKSGKRFVMDMVLENSSEIVVIDFKSYKSKQWEQENHKQVKNYIDILNGYNSTGKSVKGYLLYLSNNIEFVEV